LSHIGFIVCQLKQPLSQPLPLLLLLLLLLLGVLKLMSVI